MNLLEQNNYKIFISNYDYKSIFSKLLFKKSRFLFNMLYTRASITYDYLDKCYNNGIEITNILGKDKALEILESVEVINPEVLEKFNNIIICNEKLSERIATLEEINMELKPDIPPLWDILKPIICSMLFAISVCAVILLLILSMPYDIEGLPILENSILLKIIQLVLLPFILPFYVIAALTVGIAGTLFLGLCFF